MPLDSTHVIVVVDDQKDAMFLFRRLLDEAGVNHAIVPILDGGDAITFFERAATSGGGVSLPLICFLDLKMPKVNGFDVLSWIRRNTALETMPVIMLSSSDETRDIDRAAALGAQCYLMKYPPPIVVRETIKHAALFASGMVPDSTALFGFSANLVRNRPADRLGRSSRGSVEWGR